MARLASTVTIFYSIFGLFDPRFRNFERSDQRQDLTHRQQQGRSNTQKGNVFVCHLTRSAMLLLARFVQLRIAVHIVTSATQSKCMMDELNGRMMACQILITGLIARIANNSPNPLSFLTDFREEIKAVVKGVNITGMDDTDRGETNRATDGR